MASSKPVIHGRDHLPGGADPIPFTQSSLPDQRTGWPTMYDLPLTPAPPWLGNGTLTWHLSLHPGGWIPMFTMELSDGGAFSMPYGVLSMYVAGAYDYAAMGFVADSLVPPPANSSSDWIFVGSYDLAGFGNVTYVNRPLSETFAGVENWSIHREVPQYTMSTTIDSSGLLDGSSGFYFFRLDAEGPCNISKIIVVDDANRNSFTSDTLTFDSTPGTDPISGTDRTTHVVVTGVPVEGTTLTASIEPGTGVDSFQWEQCDAAGTSCSDIGGEVNPTYVVAGGDVGSTIRARGIRDSVLVGESAATHVIVTTPDTTSYALATAYADVGNRPAFTPTRTVNVTTAAQLRAAIADLTAGDLVVNTQSGGFAVSGVFNIEKPLSGVAVIDLKTGSDAVTFNYGGSSNFPSVYLQNARNIRIYGGSVTNPTGNAGILMHGGCRNILWWDFVISNTGGTGLSLFSTNESGGGIDGCDFKGEVSDWGNVLAWDPHHEAGTGLHGANVADSATFFTNNRIALYAHDGDTGAGIEMGQPSNIATNGNSLYLKVQHLNKVATEQVAANALQLWGAAAVGLTVHYLEADDCQGRAVDTNGASTSMAGVTVEYARSTNMCQNGSLSSTEPSISPSLVYDTRHGVVYIDAA